MKRRTLQLLFLSGPLLGMAWLIGTVARDRWMITSFLFYLPAAVVVAAGALWLILFRHHRWATGWKLLTAALTLTALTKSLAVDFAWTENVRTPRNALRVVHWNVGHAHYGLSPIRYVLDREQADIALLSEFPDRIDHRLLLDSVFPGGYSHRVNGLVLMSRLPFFPEEPLPLPEGFAWCARFLTDFGVMDVLSVDFVSNPLLSRSARIRTIADWVASRDRRIPLLVLGDFNTPRDSVCFEALRKYVGHGYEMRGRGWPYTWPLPVPVYSIDHAWLRRTKLYRYEIRDHWSSDHRRQVMDLIPTPTGGG